MKVMHEVYMTLSAMGQVQQLLLLTFLASYALSLGRLFDPPQRRRVALVALASALAFVAFTKPWVHGAMLMVWVVGVIGVFIGAVAALDRASSRAAVDDPVGQAMQAIGDNPSASSNPPGGEAGTSAAAGPGLRTGALGVTRPSST